MGGLSRRTLTGGALAVLAQSMARAAEPAAEIATSGIREVVLSTFEFEHIARAMTDVGGYRFQTLPDAPPAQFAAWHAPDGCTRIEQALLVAPDSRAGEGALRLVKFHGVPQRVMRSSQRSWDTGGIFDIDVFSRDVTTVYRGLQRHGWTALGEPVDYSEANFSVRQVVAVAPDGLMVAIIERHSPPVVGQPEHQAMSPIFNSTQMVSDYRRAVRFYTDTLGWEPRLQFRIANQAEPGADVLGLPLPQAKKADRRIGMFHPRQAPAASIELIENRTMHGRDFSADCVAPNVGILCLRIPVPDAAGYAREIEGRGGKLYTPPTALEIAPYGAVTLFAVRTPDGAILEFFDERKK